MSSATPPLVPVVGGAPGAPWVTFIPGIGNDATFWRRQADALAHEARTLRFEPWGCGESAAPPPGCTIDDVVDGIAALWDTLGIERSSVVGLGFGGSCALDIAVRHAHRVDRVAALCCRPRLPDDRREAWRERLAFVREHGMAALAEMTVERWLSAGFRAAHPDVDQELRAAIRRYSVDGYAAYVGAFIDMDLDDRLGALRAPTLLIAGEHDHGGGPVDAMRALAARLAGARLEVVEGAGHLCNIESPARVTELLRAHLV